jgi:hypothetical protein
MSKPIIINTEAEYNNFILNKFLEAAFSRINTFESGGIVAVEAHQGESIINKKSLFKKPIPKP